MVVCVGNVCMNCGCMMNKLALFVIVSTGYIVFGASKSYCTSVRPL